MNDRVSKVLILIAGAMFFSFCKNMGTNEHDSSHHSHALPHQGKYLPELFPSLYPDQIILNLTAHPTQGVGINWRTSKEMESGRVEFAASSHGPDFREEIKMVPATRTYFTNQYKSEPQIEANYYAAVLSDLVAGTAYVYRVGHDDYWSEWIEFTMPDPEANGISFIYFGDAQNEVKSMWSRVIRKAYSTMPKVDFLLHAGDLINRSARDLEWAEWFYAGSFIHAKIPSIMTPGNHEYKDVVLSPQWKPQFNLPANGPAGLEETCYEINYPQLKLISLDAEQIDESPSFKEAQVRWLDSVLTHGPRTWTAITLHYPLFSTKPNRDNPELRAALKPIIDKHRVDIVLQGHDHAYGRGRVSNKSDGTNLHDASSGTMYVVSVSGPKMYDISDKSWMTRKAGNTQLFQIIRIVKDTLHYQAYTAKGELYDAFELIKREGLPNELINKIPDFPQRLEM